MQLLQQSHALATSTTKTSHAAYRAASASPSHVAATLELCLFPDASTGRRRTTASTTTDSSPVKVPSARSLQLRGAVLFGELYDTYPLRS